MMKFVNYQCIFTSFLAAEILLINLQSLFPGFIVIDNGSRILHSFFHVLFASSSPFVNVIFGNRLQLRQPFFDVFTIRVIVQLLGPRVKNPEIGRSISAVADSPLPASTVLHGAEIN